MSLNFGGDFKVVELITFVLVGLGLFLYGITSLSKTLKTMTGKGLRKFITKCSSNRILAALTGMGITTIIQSSGGTTALTIGFVRAGLLTFVEASAIVVGANVGTCITAFLIYAFGSLPIMTWIMRGVLFFGACVLLFCTRKKTENAGQLLFSLGTIFIGLFLIEGSIKTIASEDAFANFFNFFTSNPLLGFLLGIFGTGLIQSSSATIGILQGIYAASIGAGSTALNLYGIIPIILGANIGRISVAFIASIGGTKDSKRVVLFNLLVNVVLGIVFMIPLFFMKSVLTDPNFFFTKVDPKLQIALLHLGFNLIIATLFLIILKPTCKLVELMMPSKEKVRNIPVVKDLDNNFLRKFPTQGLLVAKDQVLTMFKSTIDMYETINEYLDGSKAQDAEFIHEVEASIDAIDRNLNEHLRISDKSSMVPYDINLLSQVLKACKDVERIGDYGENLIDFYVNAHDKDEKLTEEQLYQFKELTSDSIGLIKETIDAFASDNKEKSLMIIQKRRELNAKIEGYISGKFEKVVENKETSSRYIDMVYVDILNCYERVNSHCSNIAKLYGTDKDYSQLKEDERFENLKNRY